MVLARMVLGRMVLARVVLARVVLARRYYSAWCWRVRMMLHFEDSECSCGNGYQNACSWESVRVSYYLMERRDYLNRPTFQREALVLWIIE